MFHRTIFGPSVFGALTMLAGAITASAARADTWVFDKAHTEIRFSWDHLGLSRKSGRFLDMDGTLDFTPTEPEQGSIEVSIRTASVATGVRELDDHLKSPDFFAATANPRITFKSTGVTATGERSGELNGNLTIAGITKPVTLDVTWNFTGEYPLSSINPAYQGKWVSGFSAKTIIARSDFGLKRAIPLISDEIQITIEAELLRKE
jgi:polyisoprenoid-binding protein YceI